MTSPRAGARPPRAAGLFRFGHWLERAVSYEVSLLSDRRRFHTAAARSIEEGHAVPDGGAWPPGEREILVAATSGRGEAWRLEGSAEELARHWEASDATDRGAAMWTLAAASHRRFGRLVESLSAARKALDRLGPDGDAFGRASAHLAVARAAERRGDFASARAAADAAERHSGSDREGVRIRACASACRGLIAAMEGRHEEALLEVARGLPLAVEAESAREEAALRNVEGNVRYSRGDYDGAVVAYGAARERLVADGDAAGQVALAGNLANVHFSRGEYEESLRINLAALEVRRNGGDRWGVAAGLGNVGVLLASRGEHAEARRHLEEAAGLSREVGDRRSIAIANGNLGNVAHSEGDYATAFERHSESVAISRELGDRPGEAHALANLADAALEAGRPEEAGTTADEAIRLAEQTSVPEVLCHALVVSSLARVRSGRMDRARTDAERAREVADAIGYAPGRILSRLASGIANRDVLTLAEARELADEIGHPEYACDAWIELAVLQGSLGDLSASRAAAAEARRIARDRRLAGHERRLDRLALV